VFIEALRVTLHALIKPAFPVADVAADVVLWIQAAARALTTIVVHVNLAATVPTIDVILLMPARLANSQFARERVSDYPVGYERVIHSGYSR
jgi:hypothetical protein